MDLSEIALELTRLKMRTEIHEALLFKFRVAWPLGTGLVSLGEIRVQLLSELEEIAIVLEKALFSSDDFETLDDLEKALYSDEFREMVEHMKSYVMAFTPLTS